MNAARTADVDNHTGLLVLDAEIRRCSADELERRRVMHCKHHVPLLIRDLDSRSVLSKRLKKRRKINQRKKEEDKLAL